MRDRLRAVRAEAWGWAAVVAVALAWVAWRQGPIEVMRYALYLVCFGCDAMLLVSVLETPRHRNRIVGWAIAAIVANVALACLVHPNVLLLLWLALPSIVPALIVSAMARRRR